MQQTFQILFQFEDKTALRVNRFGFHYWKVLLKLSRFFSPYFPIKMIREISTTVSYILKIFFLSRAVSRMYRRLHVAQHVRFLTNLACLISLSLTLYFIKVYESSNHWDLLGEVSEKPHSSVKDAMKSLGDVFWHMLTIAKTST